MRSYLIFLALTALTTLLTGCGKWPFRDRAPTPTPAQPPSISANGESDSCDELVVLSLQQINVHTAERDLLRDSNQLQAFVILSDQHAVSRFNYNVDPVPVEAGSVVDLSRFHAAVEVGSREPVYAWVMIVDNDELSFQGRIIASLADSFIDFLVSGGASLLVPGSGPVAGIVSDYLVNEGIAWMEEEDIIGDFAFMIEPPDWEQGRHEYTTPNGAVTVDYTIQHYADCKIPANLVGSGGAVDADPIAPQASDGPTVCEGAEGQGMDRRLNVGDMAVITVPEGRHLFLKEQPKKYDPGIRYDPGHILRIIEGPVCSEDVMYWRVVDGSGREGWVAESSYVYDTGRGTYYLTPLTVPESAAREQGHT